MASKNQVSSKLRKARTSVVQHVIPKDKRWAVRGTGNKRATSIHNTQAEAIKAAKEIARNKSSEVIIHSRDGRIKHRVSKSSADELMLRVWERTHESYWKPPKR